MLSPSMVCRELLPSSRPSRQSLSPKTTDVVVPVTTVAPRSILPLKRSHLTAYAPGNTASVNRVESITGSPSTKNMQGVVVEVSSSLPRAGSLLPIVSNTERRARGVDCVCDGATSGALFDGLGASTFDSGAELGEGIVSRVAVDGSTTGSCLSDVGRGTGLVDGSTTASDSLDVKASCVGTCRRAVNTSTDKLVTSIPMIDKTMTFDTFMRAMFSHPFRLERKSRAYWTQRGDRLS